mmetsp:Transcript_12226/g.49244  ORF Transcript_12226/g.49244 Transcript_12226/m.49244 type:complete len:755 (+) Transcript_12226:70-2334(+)
MTPVKTPARGPPSPKPAFAAALTPPSRLMYYATTASNSGFGVAVAAALYRARAGWLTWTLVVVGLTMVPRFHRVAYQTMRWPLLALVQAVIGAEFALYVALRVFVRFLETAVATPTHRELRRKLSVASDYAAWQRAARALDASKGAALWQADLRSTRYNWPFVQELVGRLRAGRDSNDWRAVVSALRLCSRPNVGGIMAPQLFSATHTGEPKTIVADFTDEIVHAIDWLTDAALEDHRRRRSSSAAAASAEARDSAETLLSALASASSDAAKSAQKPTTSPRKAPAERGAASPRLRHGGDSQQFSCFATTRELLAAARDSYGRTVLSLSGGAVLGTYHFGVARALHAEHLLPDVVNGTSAGAIVAAFICTRTDAELERDLWDDNALKEHLVCFDRTPWECAVSYWRHGVAYDRDSWRDICRWFANDGTESGVKDMTFLDAFKRTRRRLAITVCAKGKRAPPVLLTHLTSPHVVIASAITATAGVPGLIAPTVLLEKDPETGAVAAQPGGEAYFDGSIASDIPTIGLKEAFNAQFVIASQVNPHVVPMLYHAHGAAGEPSRWSAPRRSEDAWRGGFVLAALELFLRSDMLAKLQYLRDVDASPGWTGRLLTQNFEGHVTIVPNLHVTDYVYLATNPDKRRLARYLREGRVATYQKLAMIRTRMAVERAIAEGCTALDRAFEAALNDAAGSSPRATRAYPRDRSGSPILAHRTRTSRLFRVSQSTGALHWATPETINKFGADDSDDDEAYFTDDGT